MGCRYRRFIVGFLGAAIMVLLDMGFRVDP